MKEEKKDRKVQVNGFVIKIGDKELILTYSELKNLKDELDKLFPPRIEKELIPYYPPTPVQPWNPNPPWIIPSEPWRPTITWCITTGSTYDTNTSIIKDK
jgi:hypothetical protein